MPIEPASVSKPSIREVEKISSGQGLWTSMQGSSTGGKDRPFDSIWEKAVSGAQKLFGLDASESAALEEKGEQDDDAAKNAAEGGRETWDRSSGFSSRGFSFFASASPLGASAFASVSSSRPEAGSAVAQPALEPRRDRQPPQARETSMPRRDAPEPSEPVLKDKRVPEGEGEEAKDKAEKVEAKTELRPVPRAASVSAPAPLESVAAVSAPSVSAANATGQALRSPTASAVSSDSHRGDALDSGNQSLAKGEALSHQSRPPFSSVSTSRQAGQGDPASVPAPLRGIADGLAASAPAKANSGDVSGAAKPEKNGGAESPLLGSKKTAAQAGGAEGAKPSEALPSRGEPLALDAAKAREALGDALSRGPTKSAPVTATPQSNPTPSSSPAASSSPLAAGDGLGRASTAESASFKGLDASSDAAGGGSKELLKGDFSRNQARTGAARPNQADGIATNRAGTGEGVESSTLANKTAGPSPAQTAPPGLAARDAASSASRIQSPATPNRQVGLQGVGGPNAASGAGGLAAAQGGAALNPAQASQQGGAQNQGSDGSAPQDFAASLKNAASSKGTERPASDSSQAFDAKVDASSARRSQAAGKTSQTTYVTKTAEELKEVVATLTKSIDRLVTNRSGAMNFKISFEQGGSMTLRVSMEGGQIHTAMQTDVAGLETAVKAHWSELASDWNQKGVKLNAPQFQQSAEGEQRFENLSEFAQRQERQAASRQGDGRGQNGGKASSSEAGAEGQSATGDSDASSTDGSRSGQPDQVASDREWQAYA